MIALVLIYVTLVKSLNRQKRLLLSYESLDDYTGLQPKTSIDEISLLWLYSGC